MIPIHQPEAGRFKLYLMGSVIGYRVTGGNARQRRRKIRQWKARGYQVFGYRHRAGGPMSVCDVKR